MMSYIEIIEIIKHCYCLHVLLRVLYRASQYVSDFDLNRLTAYGQLSPKFLNFA